MAAFIKQFLPATSFGWTSMFVQTLAWPLTVVVIAALYRAEVRQLLERLVRVKVRDVEAQFDRDLSESERLAIRSDGTIPPDAPKRVLLELNPPPDSIIAPTPRSTRDVIEHAWQSLAEATGTLEDDPSRGLIETGRFDAPAVLLFERLRQIHRLVTREARWTPSKSDATRYADLARALTARIEVGAVGRRPI